MLGGPSVFSGAWLRLLPTVGPCCRAAAGPGHGQPPEPVLFHLDVVNFPTKSSIESGSLPSIGADVG